MVVQDVPAKVLSCTSAGKIQLLGQRVRLLSYKWYVLFFATWFSVLLISPFNASYLEIKVKLLNLDIVLKKK